MKYSKIIIALSLSAFANAQWGDWGWGWNNPGQGGQSWNNPGVGGGNSGSYEFCSASGHSGQSVKVTSNKVGNINGIGYELWADSGNNSATFYDDGSFSCSFQSAKDYLCRSGLSFDSTKTHDQIGHIYADFKLVKQNIQNVDYSYVGIYGWSRDPLVEFYVVDNWLSQYRPGDWVGNKKHGDFTIDGAQYTVYENTRTGPSIDGNTTFKQFFSIRQQARDCGRIDITAHFQQWEKLGMKLGKMHEAKVLGEAGSNGGGTSGTADFPYAKVYIGSPDDQNTEPEPEQGPGSSDVSGTCPASITRQGYPCCKNSPCNVVYQDQDGDWGVENDDWCGCPVQGTTSSSCPASITRQGYPCCKNSPCNVVYQDQDGDWGVENDNWCGCPVKTTTTRTTTRRTTVRTTRTTTNQPAKTNFCNASGHSGQSVKVTSNKVGNINGIGYELWADSGSNSATFYSDGSFSCSFSNAKDYLCRSGLSFDSTKTHDQIGHIYADFKLVKQNIRNVDYSYVGIYGWTRNPLVEFYVVDNWLSQYRPGDWVGNKKHGDFTIDGATYTVYENTRTGPSIDGNTTFKQFFSIRQQARDCGTIDITAHFKQWEKLGMRLGKMHEAKVLGEAGSNGAGTSGTADFPYAKVYIGNGGNTSNPSDDTPSYNPGNTSTTYPKGTGFQFYTQCKNRNHWALTYDDGPTQYADAILDLLKEKNIKATFFLVGNMYIPSSSSEWSRIVKRMYNEGHVIASHTYSHNDLTSMSSQQITQDMQRLEDAVYNAIGKRPAFMRPPYGSGNGNQNVMNTLKSFGITAACTWHVDPMDWDNGGNINYAKQVLGRLNGEGVITLNHLQYNGATKQGILDLSKAEIDLMLSKGYKPVTMEECLGMSAYK